MREIQTPKNRKTDFNPGLLGAIKERISIAAADGAAKVLVEQIITNTGKPVSWRLSDSLGSFKERVSTAAADEAAKVFVERMLKETDISHLGQLTAGLGALGERVTATVADEVAKPVVERMQTQIDPGLLAPLANGLDNLHQAKLNSAAVISISAVFALPDAPCALCLLVPLDGQLPLLQKQLANPVCAMADWHRMALQVAEITRKPVVAKVAAPDVIGVNLARVCAYVSANRSFYDRWQLRWTDWVILALSALALVTLVQGLAKIQRPAGHSDDAKI